MQKEIYRYVFKHDVSMREAESILHLAIVAAESLFGEPRVRMDASYAIDARTRVCVVNGAGTVGRSICRVFTGYLTCQFGPDAFSIRRVATVHRDTSTPASPLGAAA